MSSLPNLTQAQAPLMREISVRNEYGQQSFTHIPAERDLTIYVDKRELVTLMTLGAKPELLVLGYLLNQRLIEKPEQIESITIDWDVASAAVKTHAGISSIEARTAKKIVTTGCGQGSVFGSLMDDLDRIELPPCQLKQSQLYAITEAIRQQESTYKNAGSVHGCALFCGTQMLIFIEDVGRHNAIDTIAGWLAMQGIDAKTPSKQGEPYAFYTTGRLTSEMVIKAAQMGIALVLSRSGITQMGYEIAEKLKVCTLGRSVNRHFLLYSCPERFVFDAT